MHVISFNNVPAGLTLSRIHGETSKLGDEEVKSMTTHVLYLRLDPASALSEIMFVQPRNHGGPYVGAVP